MARHYGPRWAGAPITAYTTFMRGTPLLAQLFLVYYGLGQFRLFWQDVGLWWLFREPFYCALLTFTVNTAAYQAEVFRGALTSVGKGQFEGAYALGLGRWQAFWTVILPQAMIVALRPLGNELIVMIKSSSIASLVTLFDLMGATRFAFARSFDLSIYLYAAVLYLMLVETVRGWGRGGAAADAAYRGEVRVLFIVTTQNNRHVLCASRSMRKAPPHLAGARPRHGRCGSGVRGADPDRAGRPPRLGRATMITVGLLRGRMVVLVWTQRGAWRRIISMRKANDREQALYPPQTGRTPMTPLISARRRGRPSLARPRSDAAGPRRRNARSRPRSGSTPMCWTTSRRAARAGRRA